MGLIADCQLDEEEMTQFNIHLSCVIIGSLLSWARHAILRSLTPCSLGLLKDLGSLYSKKALVPSITPIFIHVLTDDSCYGGEERSRDRENHLARLDFVVFQMWNKYAHALSILFPLLTKMHLCKYITIFF